jgi:protein subunit release factor B
MVKDEVNKGQGGALAEHWSDMVAGCYYGEVEQRQVKQRRGQRSAAVATGNRERHDSSSVL